MRLATRTRCVAPWPRARIPTGSTTTSHPPYVPDDEGDEEDPYLHKVRRAGGFPQYEAQVTKSLAEIFEPKFPKLPAEVIPTIVAFWAHVGDY